MSTILIILCNYKKIMTYKSTKFANSNNKNKTFFLVLANASCPMEIIKNLSPVYLLYVSP